MGEVVDLQSFRETRERTFREIAIADADARRDPEKVALRRIERWARCAPSDPSVPHHVLFNADSGAVTVTWSSNGTNGEFMWPSQ